MARLLVLLVCVVCVQATPKLVYAGHDHLVMLDNSAKSIKASVFDYNRNRGSTSTCDVFIKPPLVSNVPLGDFISKPSAFSNMTLSYMGYELFMSQNVVTGDYVLRRCRDFNKPNIASLPCDPFVSGNADKLKYPWTAVSIGHNRVMLFNQITYEYGVYFYDADVHNGADPFHFSRPALYSGYLSFLYNSSITHTELVYATLPDDAGELLLAHQPATGLLQGFRYNGVVDKKTPLLGSRVLVAPVPKGFHISSLGDNHLMLSDKNLDFEVWNLWTNRTTSKSPHATIRPAVPRRVDRVFVSKIYSGNVALGQMCNKATSGLCLAAAGCAWCPHTKSCHAFDTHSDSFCDPKFDCSEVVKPLPDGPAPVPKPRNVTKPTVPPPGEVVELPPREPVLEEEEVPTRVIYPEDYRLNNFPTTPLVEPVHQDLSLLRHQLVEEDNAEDVLRETQMIGSGNGWVPPQGEAGPCMDDGYDANDAAHVLNVALEAQKMNNAVSVENSGIPFKVATTSPLGEASVEEQTAAVSTEENADMRSAMNLTDCLRPLNKNTTATKSQNYRASMRSIGGVVPPAGMPALRLADDSKAGQDDYMNAEYVDQFSTEGSQLLDDGAVSVSFEMAMNADSAATNIGVEV